MAPPIRQTMPNINPLVLASTQEDRIKDDIRGCNRQKSIINRSQEVYERTIRNRRYASIACSCCVLPCTCPVITVCLIGCCPCRQKNFLERIMERIGCVMLDRPPNNRWELCCTYITPIYFNLPEGRDQYSLPEERREEQERMRSLEVMNQEIRRKSTQMTPINASTNPSRNPSREISLTRPDPYLEEEGNLVEPGQEALNISRTFSLQTIPDTFPPSFSREDLLAHSLGLQNETPQRLSFPNPNIME